MPFKITAGPNLDDLIQRGMTIAFIFQLLELRR